jgi:hypothetical protein
MGTSLTPPIDLYAESLEDGEATVQAAVRPGSQTSPRENGDLDEPAVVAGERRLEMVLGW